jgi:hypothetical protein
MSRGRNSKDVNAAKVSTTDAPNTVAATPEKKSRVEVAKDWTAIIAPLLTLFLVLNATGYKAARSDENAAQAATNRDRADRAEAALSALRAEDAKQVGDLRVQLSRANADLQARNQYYATLAQLQSRVDVLDKQVGPKVMSDYYNHSQDGQITPEMGKDKLTVLRRDEASANLRAFLGKPSY